MTELELVHLFTFHPPQGKQGEHYKAINEAAMALARVIFHNTPPGSDQDAAIRKVREARMTANAAIACDLDGFGVDA